MARVIIAQWENKCISLSVLPVAQVQFPAMAEYFKGFSLADYILPTRPEPAWQKVAQSPLNGTAQTLKSRRKAEEWTANGLLKHTKNNHSSYSRKL